MTVAVFTLGLAAGAVVAGLIGAMTGLGGGVVLVPLLTLGFGVDMRYAAGASLISVIATSSGAAAAFVEDGYSNVRLGLFLEIATTLGALAGAALAALASVRLLSAIFGVLLLYAAAQAALRRRPATRVAAPRDPLAQRLGLDGMQPTPDGPRPYHLRRVPLGFALMGGAGLLSGLLGIGSGALKVLAMDTAMGVPFKVSTSTSNFMIGVTAAASAGAYLLHGYIDPGVAMPVVLGVLAGSALGARLMPSMPSRVLRRAFAVVIAVLGCEMLAGALRGSVR